MKIWKPGGGERTGFFAPLSSRWIRSGIILIAASLIACAPAVAQPDSPPESAPIVTGTAIAPAASPDPVYTRHATPTPVAPTNLITLTLWISEDFAPSATPTGRLLNEPFETFTAANPHIRIEPVVKKNYGKGGVLDFLLTTHAVAPTQLPDLALLDLAEAPPAVEAGIIQPLPATLTGKMQDTFFPFALQAARYQNQWVALPLAADAQHLVYNSNIIKWPPATWDELLRQRAPLLLPLDGPQAFLAQYFALTPPSERGAPLTVDLAATAQTLYQFKRARELNLVPDVAFTLKTGDDTWLAFTANQAPLAQVSASRYLTERGMFPHTQYAALPTRDGKPTTWVSVWGWAIVTAEPARQNAAAQLLAWLSANDRLAPWLRAAHRLGVTRIANLYAVEPTAYALFWNDTFERTTYWTPTTPRDLKLIEAWRTAINAVCKNQITPEEAARNIAAVK